MNCCMEIWPRHESSGKFWCLETGYFDLFCWWCFYTFYYGVHHHLGRICLTFFHYPMQIDNEPCKYIWLTYIKGLCWKFSHSVSWISVLSNKEFPGIGSQGYFCSSNQAPGCQQCLNVLFSGWKLLGDKGHETTLWSSTNISGWELPPVSIGLSFRFTDVGQNQWCNHTLKYPWNRWNYKLVITSVLKNWHLCCQFFQLICLGRTLEGSSCRSSQFTSTKITAARSILKGGNELRGTAKVSSETGVNGTSSGDSSCWNNGHVVKWIGFSDIFLCWILFPELILKFISDAEVIPNSCHIPRVDTAATLLASTHQVKTWCSI